MSFWRTQQLARSQRRPELAHELDDGDQVDDAMSFVQTVRYRRMAPGQIVQLTIDEDDNQNGYNLLPGCGGDSWDAFLSDQPHEPSVQQMREERDNAAEGAHDQPQEQGVEFDSHGSEGFVAEESLAIVVWTG